ncbi:MAG: glycosyltransferase [Chloroflexi bacterium]|nr:glycosyltransferase [Chloroflexota bacterium]
MHFTIFGLTLSSAWANGHATPLRALLKGLERLGHTSTFFERDVEYYARHRDLVVPDFCELVLYSNWESVRNRARAALRNADVGMVTSYCPDGLAACQLLLDTPGPLHTFYDMDAPVTLSALADHGLAVPDGAQYLTPDLIPGFDLYLSFTGGPILETLCRVWGARRTATLYGSVDPDVHLRADDPPEHYRCALGYLGTYAADRQPALERLLLEPARFCSEEHFVVAGSLYPGELNWPRNTSRLAHLDPPRHAAFYSANRLTLNITRQAMREWGYTPSGRVFEAAACGTPIVTDRWPGVDAFFEPGTEIIVADGAEDVMAALALDQTDLGRIAAAARERVLSQHTGLARAKELVVACEAAAC